MQKVLLWITVGEMMAHGVKPGSPSYESLAVHYGVVRQQMANTYSQKVHPSRSAYAKKEKTERSGNLILYLS